MNNTGKSEGVVVAAGNSDLSTAWERVNQRYFIDILLDQNIPGLRNVVQLTKFGSRLP